MPLAAGVDRNRPSIGKSAGSLGGVCQSRPRLGNLLVSCLTFGFRFGFAFGGGLSAEPLYILLLYGASVRARLEPLCVLLLCGAIVRVRQEHCKTAEGSEAMTLLGATQTCTCTQIIS